MNAPPWMAIFLVIAFYFCVCLEVLFPTAGLAGMLALVAIIAALVISFTQSIGWGIGITLFVLVTTPPLMIALVRIWPHTPMGRRILNRRPGDGPYQTPTAKTRRGTDFESLVGRRGVAISDLLPSGLVMIDGERLDAISSGEPIDRNRDVIVVEYEHRHLKVRLAKPDDDAFPQQPSQQDDSSRQEGSVTDPSTAGESSPHVSSPSALELSLDDLEE